MFKKFSYYLFFGSLILILTACANTHPAPVYDAMGKKSSTTMTEAAAAVNQPNPTASDYNVQLGVGYLQQGDVQRAKSKLLLALDQAPNSAAAQGAMGYYLENTGDTQEAEKYYQQAIAVDPKAGAAQNNYGTFLCHNGRYQQGVQHFLLATQDPSYLNTAAAYENAGLCAMQIPDDANAVVYLQKAIQQDPRRANAYLELAQLSFKQNNYPQAQQYFNQYAGLTPNMSPEGLWLGIRLARQANDTETAGRYILTLQSKYPNSSEYKELKTLPKLKSTQLMY